jgi:hypothetical protein
MCRNLRQCRERWCYYLSPTVCLAPFSPDEDALLRDKYAEMDPKWKAMAIHFHARTDILLKNRWLLLERHYKTAETAPLVIKAPDRPPMVLPAIDRRQPAPIEPESVPRGQDVTDIPWSDNEDARPKLATSSGLTGDYFCLDFPCFKSTALNEPLNVEAQSAR